MSIVYRNEKGSELTYSEVDNNFAELKVYVDSKKNNFAVLPIAQGGTGQTTAEGIRAALGLPDDASEIEYRPAGTGAVATDVQTVLRETVSVARFMTAQDLADIASGTQSSGVRAAVKKAVDYINTVGGNLIFPPGHYNSPYLTHTDAANWIEITKSGVSLVATPGSVTLENFLFYVHGSYGAPQLVGAAGFTTGDTQINTAAAHGLAAGDYVQVLSGINPYTPDAGAWQLGSQNPTLLSTPDCRFAEIHRVYAVDSAITATLYDNVIYSNYRDNTVGQSFPLAGVIGAEVRKLTPVVGVTLEGLSFKNTDTSSFREVLIRSAVNVRFVKCHFEAAGLPGAHIKTTDVLNLSFDGCTSYRSPSGAGGSSWNSFVIGGCTQNVVFNGCLFVGEFQNIDVTPNLSTSDIGETSASIRCSYLTTQLIKFSDCIFSKCSDGFTTHPATYNLTVTGCTFEGCSMGIRLRNKKSTVVGNTFKTFTGGITLSAFYEDCLINGNNFEKLPLPVAQDWIGISVVPLGTEIMNSNNFQNVVFSNNSFKSTQANSGNAGIQFRHAGDGVPANGGFTLFTDAIKTALSNYQIIGNRFVGCSVIVSRWNNGVNLVGNAFSGGSDQTHYILCAPDSARHVLNLNVFYDFTVGGFSVGLVTNPTFGYTTTHRIGYQFGINTVTGVTNNTLGLNMTGFGLPIFDGVKVSNGGSIKAQRGSGTATLNLDAEAQDGTSNVDVRVFSTNTTTGTKTFDVYGNLLSHNAYPRTTTTYTSGISTRVWSGGFTQTAFTVTSDEREKQDILDLSNAERRVASVLKDSLKSFRFKSAVAVKGNEARIHFGIIAQDIVAAFAAEGLDATRYALLCYDEWCDELDDDGNVVTPAGNRYGVRYEELLAFILGAS